MHLEVDLKSQLVELDICDLGTLIKVTSWKSRQPEWEIVRRADIRRHPGMRGVQPAWTSVLLCL